MSIDAINTIGSPFASYSPSSASMTSGQQINRAADNPAGLAVANGFQQAAMREAVGMSNANSGISLLQTADGASRSMTENILRMQELSLQAMNGTTNPAQRNALNTEFQQMMQAIDQTSQNTKFNGMNLLNGENADLSIALGDSASRLSLPELSLNSLGLAGLDLSNPANANLALESLQKAGSLLSTTQAEFGAQQNGLLSAAAEMSTSRQNSLASFSQIMDTDYARASTEKAREDVLLQAGIMMQAQGNQDRANVLALIN
ncbi:flagellin [Thiomicrospira microaerophila]|uniref:flagellin n=1 Tax=Thiomicrospira microaerophila TaxID=406020 RepID=UPI0005C8721C|nr:flagellin [Thiomicrospira microaerophila]